MTKLLGVIAIAAVAFAVAPAQAAKHSMGGCSSGKTETAVEGMPDGDGKIVAQKEVASAQDSMLNGKMGACGMHLNKAMHATMGK